MSCCLGLHGGGAEEFHTIEANCTTVLCVVQWLEFLLFIFLEFPFNLLENYDKG